MRALLLAAGYGSRLKPLTDTVPKCLVDINGKPLLEYWLDSLFNAQFDRVLINTHYLADSVNEYIKNSKWVNRIDLVFEKELLGTGSTVLANKNWFKDEPILVAHADNLTSFEPKLFWNAHNDRPDNCVMTMMTFETDAPQTCGIVEVNNNVVTNFHEKVECPPSNLANAAVYIFEAEVITLISKINKKEIDISTDVLPKLLGKIYTYLNSKYHRDIGTPESLNLSRLEYKEIINDSDNEKIIK